MKSILGTFIFFTFLTNAAFTQEEEDHVEDVKIEPTIMVIVSETGAVFKGCESSNAELSEECTEKCIQEFIKANTVYPQEAKDNGYQGTVWVEFEITISGEIGEVTIFKSPHHVLSEAVISTVLLFPRFSPATQRGRPLCSKLVFPVKFVMR